MSQRLSFIIAALTFSAALSWSGRAEAAEANWLAARARLREKRQAVRIEVRQHRAHRAQTYAPILSGLLNTASEYRIEGQAAVLQPMLDELDRLDPQQAAPLRMKLAGLKGVPLNGEDSAQRFWSRKLAVARERLVELPERLLRRCLALRAPDLAGDLVEEILAFDPDYAPVRAQLGQTSHDGRWLTRHEVAQAKKGFVWHAKLGWVLQRAADRYQRGEYYDPQAEQWTTVSAANERHAAENNPWVIDTDHFSVRGTKSLQEMVAIAQRLEVFYRRAVTAFGRFFEAGGRDGRLVLGTAKHSRLVVYVFRDRKQYVRAVPRAASWSAGIFHTGNLASYFFKSSDSTVFHEVTHQMLHVFTGANHSPPWLTEGAAVYCESAYFDDDRLVLGDIDNSKRLFEFLQRFRTRQHMSLRELQSIRTWTDWTSVADPKPQYETAGAVVFFCMDARDQRYRADFMDYLRDNYRGAAAGNQLWEYLGWDVHTFNDAMEAWALDTARQVLDDERSAAP